MVKLLKAFAHSKGGNPQDPQFWYSLNPKHFKDVPVRGIREMKGEKEEGDQVEEGEGKSEE